MTDPELVPLDVAARTAFPSGGVTAKTLLMRARQGKLTVYRPGRAYLTTLADVREMIKTCRVEPRGRGYGSELPGITVPASSPTNQLGLSETDLAKSELDSELQKLSRQK